MCVVSMIMDHRQDEWQRLLQQPYVPTTPIVPQHEVDEFKRLLDRAREYDKKHGEPECELQEKKDALKQIAKVLGVDISFVDEQTP